MIKQVNMIESTCMISEVYMNIDRTSHDPIGHEGVGP